MTSRRALGIALVLVSAFGFGSGALFSKPIYAAGVGWLVLSAWRFGLGAALSWAWLLASRDRRAGLRRLDRRSAGVAIALGVLFTANSATYFAGLETVSASLAALLVYIYPALVAVLSLRFGRRLEGPRAWAALGLALGGVVLAVGGIDPGEAPAADGLVLILASPVFYAIWIILSARLSGERQGSVGDDVDAGTDAAAATALMTTATAVTYWTLTIGSGTPVLPADVPPAAWPGLIGVGAFSTFVAIQAFYAGAQRLGAAQAALISTVEPIWTISLAALLLAERLEPMQLVGGTLILGGVVLAQTARGATRPPVRLADE